MIRYGLRKTAEKEVDLLVMKRKSTTDTKKAATDIANEFQRRNPANINRSKW